ncbi:MAG: TM0106 family RecB-like putative nuclease, partial [Actinomycetales bacterium]|nr:TM0106 family RecB-like putative nuclease [Actinomycetales bacterium]
MFVTDDGGVVTSPSDLATASGCELAFLRSLDAKLGRIEAPPHDEDAMLRRAAELGEVHEATILERYRAGGGVVVEIPRPDSRDPVALAEAVARTREAFESGADVVFQATFFDGELLGFADFIVRQPDGSYQVQDSKLARSAKVTALLQLAAYAGQLERIGVRVHPVVSLLLGDGSVSEHALADIAPVYRERRAHLRRIVAERLADPDPVAWGDERYAACGRCAVCEPEVLASRDLVLVAGIRSTTRARLVAAGITTIDQLAASTGPVEGVAESTLRALQLQAALQLRAEEGAPPPFELVDPAPIAAMPAPDTGDIFFDFEGDPLYSEPGEGDETRWGLDYLFGLVEADGTFRAFWAHSLAEERKALEEFCDYLAARRARYPGMHVYHYAAYERTHLLSIAARHGVRENEVDNLMREDVLVDLYPVVRGAVRVGSHSYSLKKIEPIYLDEARTGEVTTAGDSVEEYARYRGLVDAGRDAEAADLLAQIAAYNEDDCHSTLALRDWLLATAAGKGVRPGAATEPTETEVAPFEESPVALALRELAGSPGDPHRGADERALGLASAAVDFYRRERKSFWWGHFARLEQPIDEWADTRDVLVVTYARVAEDWHRETPRQSLRRHLRITGELAPGSTLAPGSDVVLVYAPDGPELGTTSSPGARRWHGSAKILEIDDDGTFVVRELLRKGTEEYDDVPLALTPALPIQTGSLETAIDAWASNLLAARPGFPRDAVTDVLRRTPPRTRSGGGLVQEAEGTSTVDALVASLLDLDSSYLAVQGPPGTGKTYTGAHVIADLVRGGWKIGVVAQSHATVENMLAAVLEAGLDPQLVGKKSRDGDDATYPWRELTSTNQAAFLAEPGGRVLGGTAWVFSNAKHVDRGALDLLVIDEAGQFSLAHTIAVGVSAKNLLLLGDPQQLPQVSQGTHPEPVDGS